MRGTLAAEIKAADGTSAIALTRAGEAAAYIVEHERAGYLDGRARASIEKLPDTPGFGVELNRATPGIAHTHAEGTNPSAFGSRLQEMRIYAMKLLRYGPAGHELPALLDAQGTLRSLSGSIPDVDAAHLAPQSLARLAAIDPATLPAVSGKPRLGVPFAGTRKFIAIGLNYADHAAESNLPIPTEPIVFTKAVSCLQGPNDDVMLPKDSRKTDWEVELGVVIGTTARYVEERDALEYVAGYVVVNDLSEREYQMERGGTWDKGKGCDTFGPVGPWLVTRDEVGDVQSLGMWLEVNGIRMQDGNTRTMIFGVATLISYVSRFMTLAPGDIITTGTPPGVGMGQKPEPVYLKPGDRMRLGIEKLGEQAQTVYAWRR